MEALWIFPLYIIMPLIGIILTLIGIFKIRKSDTNKTLQFKLYGKSENPYLRYPLNNTFKDCWLSTEELNVGKVYNDKELV